MGAFFFKLRFAFGVDQRGCSIRELAFRIGTGRHALRLDEDRPTRSETA